MAGQPSTRGRTVAPAASYQMMTTSPATKASGVASDEAAAAARTIRSARPNAGRAGAGTGAGRAKERMVQAVGK